ncbi:MAG: RES family NAD+ phosphorylase, partial [Terriglobales bacterium]
RWHSAGHSIVYLAESPAGALLEALVHLELPPDAYPARYGLVKAEAPDDISLRTLGRAELTGDWMRNLILTRTMGDEWLISRSTVLLRVPSVIVPETFNILLNPAHPHASRVRVLWHAEYPWDERLL